MAQWWELAIPAGSTLAAAISTGWITAFYQKRNGERLLRIQAEENEKSRQAQLDHDKEIRAEELRKEREARVHENRREAYIDFWRLTKSLESQKSVLQGGRSLLAELPVTPEHAQERAAAEEILREAGKALSDLTERQIEALTSIMFLGSPGMQQASQYWMEAQNRGSDEVELRNFESAYVGSANYELSDPNPTIDLRKFHWSSLKLYFAMSTKPFPGWVADHHKKYSGAIIRPD